MVQSVSSTRRQPKRKRDSDFIHTHQPGSAQAGMLFCKIPNGRSETGAQLYKRFGPFRDIETARAKRDEFLASLKAHKVSSLPLGRKPKAMTLGEWVDHWLVAVVAMDAGLRTQTQYRRQFDNHILPELGSIALADLTTTRLQKWRAGLASRVGAPTLNYCIKRLKTCLAAACLDPLVTGLSTDPSAGKRIRIATVVEDNEYEGSLADEGLLLAAAGETYLAPLITFGLATGLRASELAALHWRDIDWDKRQVTLRWHTVDSGTKASGTKQAAFVPGSKASAEFETVQLSEGAIEALHLVQERLRLHKFGAGRAWKTGQFSEIFYAANKQAARGTPYRVPERPVDPEALVFPARDGMPYHPAALADWFRRTARAAGVRKTIHDLRHDCGSFLLRAGVPLTVVSVHLRHANPGITAKYYAKMVRDDRRLAADTFDKLRAQAQEQAV